MTDLDDFDPKKRRKTCRNCLAAIEDKKNECWLCQWHGDAVIDFAILDSGEECEGWKRGKTKT